MWYGIHFFIFCIWNSVLTYIGTFSSHKCITQVLLFNLHICTLKFELLKFKQQLQYMISQFFIYLLCLIITINSRFLLVPLFFLIKLIGVTWVNNIVYKFQVYNIIHLPYIPLCAHHLKSRLLLSPCIWPFALFSSSHPHCSWYILYITLTLMTRY